MKVVEDYAPILHFVQNHNRISYSQFDSCILRHVNLFALPENYDFEALNNTLDIIIKTLPAIKRIFANPITHIKTSSEILPVESVRVINNETVVHASFHSELWENITRDGLKPRKLLTQQNQDNYAIYENIIFAKTIDIILLFVSKNISFLNNILHSSQDLNFNLLEREHHLLYFLAIGKLHTGYIRDYAKYSGEAEKCMEKLLFIDRVIRARINSPVYKNCKKHTGALSLKKTNIFRMHKDYHRVYLLFKWFSDFKQYEEGLKHSGDEDSNEEYRLFCGLLSLFAAGHFNFTFPEHQKIDFYNLNIECGFEGWRLKIKTVESDKLKAINFTFFKDKPYTVILLPGSDTETGMGGLEIFKNKFAADEYLSAIPFENESDSVYLSLFDIDSFRRIQQIILRGMIYSDETRDMCPFCGQMLSLNDYGDGGKIYECSACRTQIMTLVCPKTERSYFVTKIKNFRPAKNISQSSVPSEGLLLRDKLMIEKYIPAQMRYRNITEIGQDAEFICPNCGHIHAEWSEKLCH